MKPAVDLRRARIARALAMFSIFAWGCAPALPPPAPTPDAAEIQVLTQRLAADENDVDATVRLGRAYILTGRAADAVPLLDRAAGLGANADALLLLGAAHEELGQLRDAESGYEEYLEIGRDPALRRNVIGRLELIRRRILVAEAQDALAREQELAGAAPSPRTVAVFPFLLQSEDPRFEPLGRAMADLLVTDLAQTDRLTVLERLRVQMLLDEIALAGAGLVDPSTAARSGRLLGAEQVVQGSLSGTERELQLSAAVVGVTTGDRVGSLEEQDALRGLFDMEKRLALEIYRSLGIELTPAEEERVTRRQTRSIEALLSYGLGLEAVDIGDYGAAAILFGRAADADPSFSAARQYEETARRAAEAGGSTPVQLVQRLTIGGDATRFAEVDQLIPPLGGRDAASELLGAEGVGVPGGVIRVILTPSGGGDE